MKNLYHRYSPLPYIQTVVLLALITAFSCTRGSTGNSDENGDGASGTSGDVPSSKSNVSLSECIDPDLDKLKSGVEITLCDGTLAVGTMAFAPDCQNSGQTNCVTTDAFPS